MSLYGPNGEEILKPPIEEYEPEGIAYGITLLFIEGGGLTYLMLDGSQVRGSQIPEGDLITVRALVEPDHPMLQGWELAPQLVHDLITQRAAFSEALQAEAQLSAELDVLGPEAFGDAPPG